MVRIMFNAPSDLQLMHDNSAGHRPSLSTLSLMYMCALELRFGIRDCQSAD